MRLFVAIVKKYIRDFEVQKMDEIASKCFVKRGNGPKSYLSNIKGSNAVYKEFKSFIKRFSSIMRKVVIYPNYKCLRYGRETIFGDNLA